ncbi:YggT family protein [Sphingomonas sp.]|jgi:YggT family protein|uniref:YggT family protein n=1 Tax=Sphingomonas sp. TaxID=28214 RepID=UPI002EDB14D9
MYIVISLVDFLLMILNWVIVAQVVVSWLVAFNVVNRHSAFVSTMLRALDTITEPLYRPLRRILPDFGGLDFAPLVVLLVVFFLRSRVVPYLYVVTATPAAI